MPDPTPIYEQRLVRCLEPTCRRWWSHTLYQEPRCPCGGPALTVDMDKHLATIPRATPTTTS